MYVIEKKNKDAWVQAFSGAKRKIKSGEYLHLGTWYAHEKTPYKKDDKIVRDWYKTVQVLAIFKDGEWRDI
jgi:hypothetical protein